MPGRRIKFQSESVIAGLYLGIAVACINTLVVLGVAIAFVLIWKAASLYWAWSAHEGDWSCPVEPSLRLLHPLSLASPVLRPFQLTPLHIEEALELVALAFTTVVSIATASTVVQPYAVEWRWASELLRWVPLPLELTVLLAADTIPTDRATRTVAKAHQYASIPPQSTTFQARLSLSRPPGRWWSFGFAGLGFMVYRQKKRAALSVATQGGWPARLAWNQRMLGYKGPAQPSPALGDALAL
jgi:hypothetical protein